MKKKFKIILAMIFSWFLFPANAQTVNDVISNKGLQFSLRGGLDKPLFKNNAPYIEYKSGFEVGTSLDYYWNWFGLGFDFDYINNGTKNGYPTSNLFTPGGIALNSFTIQEDKITRMFYGAGPDFRYLSKSRKFQVEDRKSVV